MTEPLQKIKPKRKIIQKLIPLIVLAILLFSLSIYLANYKVNKDRSNYCELNEEKCTCLRYKSIAKEEIFNYNKYYIKDGEPVICKTWCKNC